MPRCFFFLTVESIQDHIFLLLVAFFLPSSLKKMVSFLPFTSRSRSTAADTEAPLGTGGGKQASSASPFARFKQAAAEMTSSSSSSASHMLVPGAPLPRIVLPVVHVSFLRGKKLPCSTRSLQRCLARCLEERQSEKRGANGAGFCSFFSPFLSLFLFFASCSRQRRLFFLFFFHFSFFVSLARAPSPPISSSLLPLSRGVFPLSHILHPDLSPTHKNTRKQKNKTIQGGHVELGSPTGEFVLIVVARGRVCPVSRNYVAALAELSGDLEALGVETIVISGSDGRAAAAACGDAVKAAASASAAPGGGGGGGAGGGGSPSAPGSPVSHPLDDLPFKLAYGMTPEMMQGEEGFFFVPEVEKHKKKKNSFFFFN